MNSIGSRSRRALFWAAALFALVMALLPNPPALPFEPSDKIEHMAAFAVLGALGAWAFPATGLIALLVGLSLFGALIELLQSLPEFGRDADPLDWLADTIACAVVLALVAWHRRWRSTQRRQALRRAARPPISRG